MLHTDNAIHVPSDTMPNAQPHNIGTHRESEPAYSGASKPGLNEQGTYDRMIWNGENAVHESIDDVCDVVQTCLRTFQKSNRSRLMIRLQADPGINTAALRTAVRKTGMSEVMHFGNSNEEVCNIFAGLNENDRAMKSDDIEHIQQSVTAKVLRNAECLESREAFTRHALQQMDQIRSAGYSFGASATKDEMLALWQHSFGWSEEQCAQQETEQGGPEKIHVLRDNNGNIVSGVYVYENETTEWSTRPEFQKKGLIVPLLIYSNCRLLRDGVRSVFAEARWNRSVSASIKSGLRIPLWNDRQWLLTNHVTIGEHDSDPPDTWNRTRTDLGDGTKGSLLRTFAVAHLDETLYTDDIFDAYLSHL